MKRYIRAFATATILTAESDEYYCNVNLDEDEMARFMSGSDKECCYYKAYDEYKMVQKQN